MESGLQEGGHHGTEDFTPVQIISKLREAEPLLNEGRKAPEVCRTLGVTENTYYRWRKKYCATQVTQACQLKGLQKENDELKKLVADLSLDSAILKEVNKGNF